MADDRVLADTLCRDHLAVLPDSGGRIGTEVALLVLLDQAVGSSSGKGSTSGGSDPSTRSLVDSTALELRASIEAAVTEGLARLGCAGKGGTLAERAGVWLWALPPGGYATLEPVLAQWVEAIRTLLDPPQQVRLRGVHCSACGYSMVLLDDPLEPGREVQAPALVVTVSAYPTAVCRVCGVEFDTPALYSLGDGVS